MQIIRVDPPDRDRLRYLTVSPPPSMNTSSISAQILAIQDGYGVGCPETEHHDAIAEILEMVRFSFLNRPFEACIGLRQPSGN